jgi:hypothetical protein
LSKNDFLLLANRLVARMSSRVIGQFVAWTIRRRTIRRRTIRRRTIRRRTIRRNNLIQL